jgi:membrane-bound serine protease (ClpP class)
VLILAGLRMRMDRTALLFFVLLWSCPAVLASAVTAVERSQAPVVDLLTYDGVINPVAAEYIADGIVAAESAHRAAVVLQLDTPGGLDTSMRIIIKAINASTVPVIVYVSPSGSRAASAGTFITLAAQIAAMAPGTNIGSAHPVSMGGGEMDEDMKKKVENDAAAYIRSIADKRGRNAAWAEEAVRKSVNVTEQEAVKLKIVDLVADDVPALLSAVDGRLVEMSDGKQRLATKGAEIVRAPLSWRLRLLNALIDPNVAYVLMLLGTYGLLYELMSPGAVLPGVIGSICLILAFYAFQTLPINYAGLLLIVLAVILFVAEIKVPSYGLLTVGGIVAMFLGSVMLMKSQLPYLRISLKVIVPSVLGTALFFLFVVGMAVRTFGARPVTGAEGLVGRHGIARSDLGPTGTVFVHGELWEAQSGETIHVGDEVVVTAVEGLRLKVKRATDGLKEEG